MNDPYKPPQEPYAPPMNAGAPQERGGCLTALLVLMMIANPLTGIVYFAAGDMVKKGLPNAPDWTAPVLGVIAFVMFASAIAMFRFKKWGLYGALTCAAIALVVNLTSGVNPVQALFGAAIAPTLLIVLIKPRWHLFT
jgi:hypothetical protein